MSRMVGMFPQAEVGRMGFVTDFVHIGRTYDCLATGSHASVCAASSERRTIARKSWHESHHFLARRYTYGTVDHEIGCKSNRLETLTVSATIVALFHCANVETRDGEAPAAALYSMR